MKSNTADSIKKRSKSNDVFYTPITLVRQHYNIISEYISANDVILDPFFGTYFFDFLKLCVFLV